MTTITLTRKKKITAQRHIRVPAWVVEAEERIIRKTGARTKNEMWIIAFARAFGTLDRELMREARKWLFEERLDLRALK